MTMAEGIENREESKIPISTDTSTQCLGIPADKDEMIDAAVDQQCAGDQDLDRKPIGEKPLSFYLGFICLLIMILLVSLDSTCMAVSISTISEELDGTTFEAFWASLAYMLADVVTLPLYASASDVLGRKIPLYTSFVFAVTGSVLFATARSMEMVIVGRLIQGLGGGGLDALNEILIVDITTLKERPLYLGVYLNQFPHKSALRNKRGFSLRRRRRNPRRCSGKRGLNIQAAGRSGIETNLTKGLMAAPLALGTIVGPLMGSAFTQYVSWRWLGWVNLPLLGVDMLLAALSLRLKPLEEPLYSRFARVDWAGFLIFAVGTTASALPLSWAANLYPWSSWKTILPLLIGLIVLLVFGYYERKPQRPIFPYRIFQSRTGLLTLTSAAIHGLIVYPTTIYLPLLVSIPSTVLQTHIILFKWPS